MANLSLAFEILAKDKASKEFKAVGDAADDAGKKTSKFGAAAKVGAAAAGTALVALGKSSVTAFVEAEQSSVRLDEALKKFPATADRTRASFDALNASLARKTRFDDDATASGQAVLAQFGLTGAQIQELTPLLQDYAAKTGKDIPTAAQDLGKAVLGQGRALKAVGLDLKDTGSATGNLEGLMAGLRTQVGGFATAEGQTAAGTAAILRNQFGELQEEIGSKLVPVLTSLAVALLATIDFIDRNSAVIIPLGAAVGVLAGAVLAVNGAMAAAAAVTAAWTAVANLHLASTVANTAALVANKVVTLAVMAAYYALTAAQVVWTGVTKAAAAAQVLLNVALTANPIGLVIAAIALLAAGLVLAYKKSETFRNMVNDLFGALKKFIGFTPLGLLINNFDEVKRAVGAVIDKVSALIGAIGRIRLPKLDFPGIDIPGFAAGGFARGLAVVGERGPELVNFGSRGAQVYSNADSRRMVAGTATATAGPMTATVPVVINLDGRVLARAVADVNLSDRRR